MRTKENALLKLRLADSTKLDGKEMFVLPEGIELTVEGEEQGHYCIRAWVWKGQLIPEPKKLTESDFIAIANKFKVDLAAVKAVVDVEASGSGFLPNGKPKILFEAHWFGKLTQYKYNKSHANISSTHWNRSLYKGGVHEWGRLDQAIGLSRQAALQSASWGLGQVMGFNYRTCGYSNVEEFVDAMHESEGKQVEAMFAFIQKNKLIAPLNRKDWRSFAEKYNGPSFSANDYDGKLARAYAKFSAM